MGTRNERNHWLLALALTLTLLACGDDSDEQGPPDTGGGFTNVDAGADEPDADEEEPDGEAEDAGETLQASAEEAKKNDWVEGCYKKPTNDKELLNSCATGWRTFDESLYPSSWKVGDKLPPVP